MKCPIQNGEGPLLMDPVRPAALEEHIRACPACSGFVAAQKATDRVLDLWEAPPISTGFDARLYSRINREVPWWDILVRPFRPALAARGVPVAAAAGLLIAAGLWIERPGLVPPAQPDTAEVEPLPPEQAEHALQDMEIMQEFSRLLHADAADSKR